MKNTLLCVGLLLATGGGVAFLVASHPSAPPPATEPPVTSPSDVAESSPGDPLAPCPTCPTGEKAVVYDVTDLSARFAAGGAKGEFVSFDEPPLAKPTTPDEGVRPVGHEEPAAPLEELPPPRKVN